MKRLPINLWTAEQDIAVMHLTAEKRTAAAIAEIIGRSATAVRIRRRHLGCSPGNYNNGKQAADRGTRVECLLATIEQAKRDRRAKAYVRELRKGLIVLRAREQGV